MEIKIDPPLLGQLFGMDDIDRLLISSKWTETSLYPVSRWPLPVYVMRIIDESILRAGSFRKDQVELIAWGMIYKQKGEILIP
jgi:hypothetical protein